MSRTNREIKVLVTVQRVCQRDCASYVPRTWTWSTSWLESIVATGQLWPADHNKRGHERARLSEALAGLERRRGDEETTPPYVRKSNWYTHIGASQSTHIEDETKVNIQTL